MPTERLGLEPVAGNQYGADAARYAKRAGEQALERRDEVLLLTVPALPSVLSIAVRYVGGGVGNQIFETGQYPVPKEWLSDHVRAVLERHGVKVEALTPTALEVLRAAENDAKRALIEEERFCAHCGMRLSEPHARDCPQRPRDQRDQLTALAATRSRRGWAI